MSFSIRDGLSKMYRPAVFLCACLVLPFVALAGDRHEVAYTKDPNQTRMALTVFDQDHPLALIHLAANGDVRHESIHTTPKGLTTLVGVFNGHLSIQDQSLSSHGSARFLAVFDGDLLLSLQFLDLHQPAPMPTMADGDKGSTPEGMTETGTPIEPPDDIDP